MLLASEDIKQKKNERTAASVPSLIGQLASVDVKQH